MKEKLFSRGSVVLMLLGFVINIIMVYIVTILKLPVYFDSIGTILVSILGGILPGITVGFFSNIITYLFSVSSDPLTLYYGIISVLLSVIAVYCAKYGLYKKISVTILSAITLACIGGGLGSVLTWILYGFSFGENISSEFVLKIYYFLKCLPFVAQLIGDFCIDLLDKSVTLLLVFVIIQLIPKKILVHFPYGFRYVDHSMNEVKSDDLSIKCRKKSLKVKLTLIIIVTAVSLGMVSTFIGMYIHYTNTMEYYQKECKEIAAVISGMIDGNQIDEYLHQEADNVKYMQVCNEMNNIKNNMQNIETISVFCIEDHKNRVIFETTQDGENVNKGISYIVWPYKFQKKIDEMEEQSEKAKTLTMKQDNSIMVLQPVYDNNKKCTAYIVVEMNSGFIYEKLNIYFIRIFSLLFGIGIIIVGYVFWFYDHSILQPIKILLYQTKEVADNLIDKPRLREEMKVTTGDELELLFNDMCEAEDSIIRSDKASKSKTAFLSKLSHEIRTPLNSVIGFSRLAINERKTITNEELLDYMQKIQLSGSYLLELVSDVLDISRIEEGRMAVNNEACRLDDLIEEVVNSFQGQMKGKNIDFVVDKDCNDVLLYMDNFHTVQILNNLISNACKYTEEGGVVGFEVHTKQLNEKKVEVTYIIQDTGIGMSEEFQKKIFEPFTQDKRGMKMKKQLRGSGLGMSICKNLVDLLGGTIVLESAEGEGSCFTVKICYELIGRAKENDQCAEEDYSILKGKKILVVDDLELNRIVVEKFLKMYGLEFEDAEDGRQAYDKFMSSSPGEYFTIFMDVQMPEMNGYEATQAIRKSGKEDCDLPIIGMTADAFSDDVKKAKDSGMNYHVTKPIQVQKILNILLEISK